MKKCVFCQKSSRFPQLLNLALYSRYQQDYCQFQLRSKEIIEFQDDVCLEEDEEYLKSYYTFPYLKAKQKQLIEYYRYHQDIPRFFIHKITPLLEDYHERQREIRYRKIKQQLGMVVEDRKEQKKAVNQFKALQGLTETKRTDTQSSLKILVEMLNTMKQPIKIKINSSSIANLISQQKQQMKSLQTLTILQPSIQQKPKITKLKTQSDTGQLRKILGNPLSPKQVKQPFNTNHSQRNCLTQNDYQTPKLSSYKSQSTKQTQHLPTEGDMNDFYKRWSNIISHRELQFQQKRMRTSLFNKKKQSLK